MEKKVEKLLHWFFALVGVSSVVFLLAIVMFIGFEAFKFLSQVDLGEILKVEWKPEDERWGMLSFLVSTGMIAVVAGGVSIPVGLLLAIYMSEVASPAVRKKLKALVESITSIPTIALGLFGLILLAPLLTELLGMRELCLSALTAGLLVGFIAIPIVASISEDVLTAVPQEFRHASYALGATKWQTVRRMLIPASMGGLLAAIMLALGRIVGETMIVYMVAGNSLGFPESFLSPARPLTSNIAIEVPETVVGELHYYALFTQGFFLLLIALGLNLTADWMLQRHKQKFG